jgi:hypothetical protein
VAHTPHEEPFSEAHLGSPEYRERLMRKLNCLIAVLEVATAKVRKSMAGSSTDSERLARICANLQSTLEVCQRARVALERRQVPTKQLPERSAPAEATLAPASTKKSKARRPAPRVGSDISTEAERRKFAILPPIDPRIIERIDLDELARRLSS